MKFGGLKMLEKPHIVSFVLNKVEGDSRVIKTAQAAMRAGYKATIVGVGSANEEATKVIQTTVEGVPVRILPNYVAKLKRQRLWRAGSRDLRLFIGGQAQIAVPEIVSLAPSLIHSHDMYGLKVGAAVSKALMVGGAPIPWVHDLHEYVAGLRGEQAEAYMPVCLAWERELLHQASALLTVSDALAEKVQKRYQLKNSPTVIYNAPTQEAFSDVGPDVRSSIGLDRDVPLVAFVGNANALRGCPTIVEGVSKCPEVHLAFVSEGTYVDKMKALASSLGMSERFHVLPLVASDKVSTFIRTADVGIHGLVHYPNAEVALPNKLFEYIHALLPVVVSDVESMKSFVERNGVGLCFKADDPDSCAEAVKRVLQNRNEFRSAITNALLQEYSWETQAGALQAIYSGLLSSPLMVNDDERRDAIAWEKNEEILLEAISARALAELSTSPTVPLKKSRMRSLVKKMIYEPGSVLASLRRRARSIYRR